VAHPIGHPAEMWSRSCSTDTARASPSSRVIEQRCVRDVAYRVIAGRLRRDHATIARFRARHETALGGLFSQVLRLLAAEGMVSLGTLSLDGTKLAGNVAQTATIEARFTASDLTDH
jgi:transposase